MGRDLIEKEIVVCPTDVDPYNIIHHPMYLVWCEMIIIEYFHSKDISFEKNAYEIVDYQCKFISPGFMYDRIKLVLQEKCSKEIENGTQLIFSIRILGKKNANLVKADYTVNLVEL